MIRYMSISRCPLDPLGQYYIYICYAYRPICSYIQSQMYTIVQYLYIYILEKKTYLYVGGSDQETQETEANDQPTQAGMLLQPM